MNIELWQEEKYLEISAVKSSNWNSYLTTFITDYKGIRGLDGNTDTNVFGLHKFSRSPPTEKHSNIF